MELALYRVPDEASQYEVTKSIAEVLHCPENRDIFGQGGLPEHPRPLNFKVVLKPGHGGLRNNTTGTLTLHSKALGRTFLGWLRGPPKNHISVTGRRIRIVATDAIPPQDVIMTLEKAPYVEPDREEGRQRILDELNRDIRVDEVQFGVLCPNTGPKPGPRNFSIECKDNYTTRGLAKLKFEWEHKLIRVTVGSQFWFPYC